VLPWKKENPKDSKEAEKCEEQQEQECQVEFCYKIHQYHSQKFILKFTGFCQNQ
jgi:hypothetical protein